MWGATGNFKPKLFEFSSPSYPIDNFVPPYDAILKNPNAYSGNAYLGVGRRLVRSDDPVYSDRTGVLYYYSTPELIGVCHGYGRDDMTHYTGYNFYNAPYPAGYITPPYGETPTIHKLNIDEWDNLQNGACAPLSLTEYNEQYGIVSKVSPQASAVTDTLTPNAMAQIMSLKETCPDGTIAIDTYYEEVQLRRIPGTVTSLGALGLYNDNPIPTSLDSYDIWLGGRYKYTTDNTNPKQPVNNITFGADGRPLPENPSGVTNHSKLNNTLCYAQLFETDTSIGKLTNGIQRIETPDTLWGSIGSQVSAAGQEPWHYWHFLFRENAETIPFDSYFKQIRPGVTHRTISEGTQMFTPILSSADMYWQNRQCPDTVDFLPYTFGASIYACPSEHFDVPYYAAIKKFGFYGMRFVNTCKRLDLANSWNGVENASEVPTGTPIAIDAPETEPEVDIDGNWSFSMYSNLLRVAKAEERYSNMYALNKGFFLWSNTGCIYPDARYKALLTGCDGFGSAFTGMILKFQEVYQNGLTSFLSGEPRIIIKQGETSSAFSILDSGLYSDILFTNNVYDMFRKHIESSVTGESVETWNSLETDYAYYFSDCNSGINEPLYKSITSGREKRMRTRYFENFVRGNPIDLYPMNHIPFGTDRASDYFTSTGWSRSPDGFGKGSHLPPIMRRYFEGAYGNASATSGLLDVMRNLTFSTGTAFYPGFFNEYNFGNETPLPQYVATLSGYIKDKAGRRFSPSGWLAAGYNEIGALNANFSCFTPIFVQQPLAKVFCKIGQHPTLRALAVDYHSIPEDKMNYRNPEIAYWTNKLKISDSNFDNNYQMKYKWFRVLKSSYNSFALSADFSLASFSSPTGTWCALEGDRNTCTIIHPQQCVPAYASHVADAYTFLKGVDYNLDDNYYYYCMAFGRFGVRISEPVELVIEDWVRFDVSLKNGMNLNGQVAVNFIVNDWRGIDNTIRFSAYSAPPYAGYQFDKTSIPESVVEQKIPPPNAGFGDVSATRFVGPVGYVGTTRTYTPDTLKDTRGLREAWGRLIEYGNLIPLQKKLSQTEGDLLYGYQHLPVCTNYTMARGQKGVRVKASVNGNYIGHWALGQKAYAVTDSVYGMRWDKINGIGSLYPPASNSSEAASPNMGMGHWQWGNNLGAIKRFGKLSSPTTNDLVILGRGSNEYTPPDPQLFKKIQEKFVRPNTLGGSNCGYTKYGLGRNMLYYIEAFDRFYLICDPVKKKNVQNKSFMCPGLRFTNSAMQYFWLGQPSNTYVERRSMYGPYAYQWRVRRHNRDRNGNGISEGFYSMNYETRYELMYDAPAIYGLYLKKDASPSYKQKVAEVIALRKKLFPILPDIGAYRTIWFGEAGSEGTSRRYGNYTFSCDPNNWAYNKDMCDYVSAAKGLSDSPDFGAYNCPEDRLKAGQCFDPCLSLRMGQGYFPGGKAQTMFGYAAAASNNQPTPRNLRLVSSANFKNDSLVTSDEQSPIEPKTYFRSPVNTPHARVWRGYINIVGTKPGRTEGIVGVSPCRDGGSDHCNYTTATIHLDNAAVVYGSTTAFVGSAGFAANTLANASMRGDD